MFDVFLFYIAFAILGFGVLKNKKLLLEKYGSVSKISKLTKEELMLLLSKNQAQLVYDYYNKT